MLCLLFVLAAPSPLAMEDVAALQPWMDLENKPPIWHICGLHAGPTTSEQAVPTEATNECDAVAEQGTLNVQVQKGGGISKLFGGGDERREAESRVYTKRCNAFHICRAYFPLDATTTKYYTQARRPHRAHQCRRACARIPSPRGRHAPAVMARAALDLCMRASRVPYQPDTNHQVIAP